MKNNTTNPTRIKNNKKGSSMKEVKGTTGMPGIRSVDVKIKAFGHGAINWNGPITLNGGDGKTVNNHTLPKLRGYTSLTGKIKEDTGYKYRKEVIDIDFKKTPLYISQNCARYHIFIDQAHDSPYINNKTVQRILSSMVGLVRGYAITSSQYMRASALLLEDFIDQLGNGNFEQFSRAGERDSSSFFSKTTFGDTEYISYCSINIEQLQLISLDKKFGRCAMTINEGQGEEIAGEIQAFIKSLNPELSPEATFHENYVRKGARLRQGQMGILLNNDAIQIIVEYMLEMISELSIRQAKSYMYVDSILVDYNDSHKTMRIKRDESVISEHPESDYATYFYAN